MLQYIYNLCAPPLGKCVSMQHNCNVPPGQELLWDSDGTIPSNRVHITGFFI